MITALAISFMLVLFALGARPSQRQLDARSVKEESGYVNARSGSSSGLYGETAPAMTDDRVSEPVSAIQRAQYLTGSGVVVIGPGRILGVLPDTPNTFISNRKTEDRFTLKTLPPCFVCGTALTEPYFDRDYYCDHCKSFVSRNAYPAR